MLDKASTYPDNETLLACVNEALERFTPDIGRWLVAASPRCLVLDGDAGRPVGTVMYADRTQEESPLYRVVLVKDPRAHGGWTLRTTFLRRSAARRGFAALDKPLAHLVGAYLNEDVGDYAVWQEALAEMGEDAPDLYAALPGEIEALLQQDDATVEAVLCSLDFGMSTEQVSAREFLEMVLLQLRVMATAHASLRGEWLATH